MGDEVNFPDVEHPRGIYPARIDDKGRLKLPVDFQRYLTQTGSEKVFVTSFDERIARIYSIPVWKEIETLLRTSGEDAESAEDLWFAANDLGGDSELDGQGRLLMPAELRRALGIENQSVHLQHYKGHIRLYSDAVYEQMKQRSRADREEKLRTFEKKGLL